MKRSTDELLTTYPCEIVLNHCHNHPIVSCDTLRHRRPNLKIEKKFLEMYRNNHSPSSALATHKYDIQVNHPENWFEKLADGGECPDLQWCYHLYRKTFQKEYGAPSGPAMVEALSVAVDKYNNACSSTCAAVATFRDTDLIVVLCSPLMKRVHQFLKSSGEVNFLDSGGMMDRHNTRIFTLLAPSVAGALPLGILMSSSESEDALTEGMKMLKTIMPPNAFYGRGPSKGPQVMMTDDSTSERNALKFSFPGIILLLCLFHVLNAFCRYVWDSKHKVAPKDKESIYHLFHQWCYSKTEAEFKERYFSMLKDCRIGQNSCLVKQITGLCARAPQWALCYRSDLLIRGNNTNNYSERTIRSYKDEMCFRLRAYSPVQLFDFCITRLEAFFERRIAAVLNNRKENYCRSKHFIDPSKLKSLECFESSHDNTYVVKNLEKGTQYFVNMDIEICSCFIGFNGAPCKHQCVVAAKLKLSTSQFLPYDDEGAKLVLHQIMTTLPAKSGWYAPLKGGPTMANTVDSGSGLGDSVEDGVGDFEDSGAINPGLELQSDMVQSVEAMKMWQSINDFIVSGLEERPDTFASAILKFGSTFNKGKALSENTILSALHNFSINSFRSKSLKRGRYIHVNTAATVRRKYAKMGGRKVTHQGRPPRATYTAEHGY